MISISSRTLSKINKIGITFLFIYSLGFIIYKAGIFYKTYFEKERLTKELNLKKMETDSLKKQINGAKADIQKVEKSYVSKAELESKIKDIYSRMSLFDYQLNYIDSKKMCVDRYIIITKVQSDSENGLKAAEGILSYLGELKKSEKDETLYFINYISMPREVK